jgi:hypothetical protein
MTSPRNLPEDQRPDLADEQTDPLTPIMMPKVSKIGSRALALIGAASVLSLGINVILVPGTMTPTTVSK